jgi:Zn-dependent peptidase ImmA (M78 family)
MKNVRNAEKKADALLKALGINTIPIPLDKITSHFGITISHELSENISGVLITKGTTTVIGVNPSENHSRQRFTIAHEIGHYILHKGDKNLFVDEVMFRSDKKDLRELEANAFATALLMPEELIDAEIKSLGEQPVKDMITSLAQKFEVSTVAMTYKLSNLGWISPDF